MQFRIELIQVSPKLWLSFMGIVEKRSITVIENTLIKENNKHSNII